MLVNPTPARRSVDGYAVEPRTGGMATSAFAAVVDRYESLSGVPTLYSFDSPVSADGTQVLPPYAVIRDDGTVPSFDFEHTVVEVTELAITIYAATLANVDLYAERAKYNGGSTVAGLGLDFGALPTLTIPYSNLVVAPNGDRHFCVPATGNEAQRIHARELKYQITLWRG